MALTFLSAALKLRRSAKAGKHTDGYRIEVYDEAKTRFESTK
jgi:hypothetical protein